MCKALSPSVFLAISFSRSKKSEMRYEELEGLRQKLTQLTCAEDHETYDVDWGHDAVQFALGFYSPVFREVADGIFCNQQELEKYYTKLLSGLKKQEREKLEHALA